MNYRQCELQKGTTKQTSWIPEQFAKVGKFIKIKEDNGWQVLSVNGRCSDEMLNFQNQGRKELSKSMK